MKDARTAASANRLAEDTAAITLAALEPRLAAIEETLSDLVADQLDRRRPRRPAPVRDGLRPLVLTALGPVPQPAAEIERAVGREPQDRGSRAQAAAAAAHSVQGGGLITGAGNPWRAHPCGERKS